MNEMMEFDAAQARMAEHGRAPGRHEDCAPADLSGRILAQTLLANLDLPPADNSAMDGYALRLADLASGRPLPIQQHCFAGDTPEPLQPGHATRLFTGSLLPDGADTIAIQEDCEEAEGAVRVLRPPAQGAYIRRRGEDMARGAVVLARGTLIGPAQIAVLAAQGFSHVPVYPRLRIGLLTTGDELIAPGQDLPNPAAVYNANGPMLAALCAQLGAEPTLVLHARDEAGAIRTALQTLTAQCDLVLSVGGASVGEKDLVKPAIEALGGTLDLWRVRMKPGKPVALADIAGRTLVCLPGNPVSAFVVFTLLVTPLIRAMQGRHTVLGPVRQGVLRSDRTWGDPREEFLRVRAAPTDGLPALIPYSQQSSGVISSLPWSDGIARVTADTRVTEGARLNWYAWSDWLR